MTEIQHELIMPNKDLPFKMFLFEGRDGNYIREKHWHRSIEIFAVFQGTLGFIKRSGVFTGMWRFYYCQFQRSAFHSCTKRKYDGCAPDAA